MISTLGRMAFSKVEILDRKVDKGEVNTGKFILDTGVLMLMAITVAPWTWSPVLCYCSASCLHVGRKCLTNAQWPGEFYSLFISLPLFLSLSL